MHVVFNTKPARVWIWILRCEWHERQLCYADLPGRARSICSRLPEMHECWSSARRKPSAHLHCRRPPSTSTQSCWQPTWSLSMSHRSITDELPAHSQHTLATRVVCWTVEWIPGLNSQTNIYATRATTATPAVTTTQINRAVEHNSCSTVTQSVVQTHCDIEAREIRSTITLYTVDDVLSSTFKYDEQRLKMSQLKSTYGSCHLLVIFMNFFFIEYNSIIFSIYVQHFKTLQMAMIHRLT